ncbi:tail completion protein gp17 [Pontixanthobacter sp.]|uniref:tail completion protein gp17 n=1 Tax=Pontixanthobacter sp. TaxID=2792078 RepID=UPI003C79CFB6
MDHALRAALLTWLNASPDLSRQLNSISEDNVASTSAPFLTIAASAAADWSTKDRCGREIRIAVQLSTRGDDAAADGELVRRIEKRISDLPRVQNGFDIINTRFLRARTERLPRNQRAVLLEYSFRLFQTPSE